MKRALASAFVLAATFVRAETASADPTRAGTLVEPAALPSAGRATNGSFDGGAMWSFAAGSAANVGASPFVADGAPYLAAHRQLLFQASAGFDLTGSLRYRALGNELVSSQVDSRLAIGRTFGRVALLANALVGRGVGVRTDVDFESGALAAVSLSPRVRVGAEGRVRGELEDRYVTAEDEGRPVELLSGGIVGASLDGVYVQTLAGWMWPRGFAEPGPAALATAAFLF